MARSYCSDDPLNTPDLTPDERNALDRNTVKDLTTLLHIRNAYAFIHAWVDDHQVAGLLEICAPGHARQAMDAFRRFFLPNSHAGRRAGFCLPCGLNVWHWVTLVRQLRFCLPCGLNAVVDGGLYLALNSVTTELGSRGLKRNLGS